MKKCPSCGHESESPEMKCPACGNYYSKVIELIAEEEENEEKNSFKGRCKRVFYSDNVKHELLTELRSILTDLSSKAKFTLFVVFVFVFALVVSVM